MKHLIILLGAIGLSVLPLTAQSQFGMPFFVDTFENETVTRILCADFNRDDQADFMVSNMHWPYDHIRLYIQQEAEHFIHQNIEAADSLSNLTSFDVADLNGDGWMDFVACYGFPFRITWFENQQDHFVPHLIADSLDFTMQILICDFDRNGWPDLLALQHIEIVVYLAVAPGIFNHGSVIHGGTEFYAMETGDFNGDSLPDVAVASGGFETLLGDGTGHFTSQDETGIHLVFGLKAGDLDGDGDLDMAAYDVLSGIQLYRNDGQGHFDFSGPILSSTDQFLHYELQDLNCDGSLDVVAPLSQFHQVVMVLNEGEGQFTLPSVIHEQDPELIMAVTTGDLDRNMQPDVLWGNKTIGARLNECEVTSLDHPEDIYPGFDLCPNLLYAGDVVQLKVIEPLKNGQLYILDISGRILSSTTISGNGIEIACPQIPGAYIVMLRDQNQVFSSRLIVQ